MKYIGNNYEVTQDFADDIRYMRDCEIKSNLHKKITALHEEIDIFNPSTWFNGIKIIALLDVIKSLND